MATFKPEPTVAVICPLDTELRAVLAVFDHLPQEGWGSDDKPYYHGLISKHSAVALSLPTARFGVVSAGRCAAWLENEFPSLQHRFLVGIAGGIPDKELDIRLGDVVIGTHICKYDSGKWVNGELRPRAALKEAPLKLLDAISMLKTLPQTSPDQLLGDQLVNMKKMDPKMVTQWTYPDAKNALDLLFEPGYACSNPSRVQCSCDPNKTVKRVTRQSKLPRVHYGLIASGDQVMKDDKRRDKLKDDFRDAVGMEVLAVEMEAAALDDLGYMVIRGICDYADSHKNKNWQGYAAATAAACFKAVLARIGTPNPDTSTRAPRAKSVDVGPSQPGSGYPYFHNPFGANPPHNSVSNGDNFPEAPVYRAVTHDPTLKSHSQSSRLEKPPSPLPSPSSTACFQSRSPRTSKSSFSNLGARSTTQPEHAHKPMSTSSSQEYKRDSSPHSTVSSLDIRSETKSANSVLQRRIGKWPLSKYCCKSSLEHQIESAEGHAAELKLFQEGISNEPLKTSRTIEIHDSSCDVNPFISWIPLDGIQVSVQLGQVHLEYSNCNAQKWDTVDGRGQYRCIYDDRNPNLSADFDFLDSESASEFANLMLLIDCALPGYRHLERFQTIAGICSIGSAPETANETSDQTQQGANIIINTEITHDNPGTRISSVFGLGSYLDYDFEISQGVIKITLGQLRKADYKTPTETSPIWPPHWVRSNRDGKPQELGYHESKSFDVRFREQNNNSSPWETFMMKITGWQPHSWQSVSKHGHDAQMMIWSRESNLKLLCKARVRKSRQKKWYSLDLSRDPARQGSFSIGHRFRHTLIFKQVLCSEGVCIDRSMTPQAAQGPQQNRISDEKFKFTDDSKARDFEAQIKKLMIHSNP